MCVHIYIYIYIERERDIHERRVDAEVEQLGRILGRLDIITITLRLIRPVHLLRVFLLRVLESNFPGDPL